MAVLLGFRLQKIEQIWDDVDLLERVFSVEHGKDFEDFISFELIFAIQELKEKTITQSLRIFGVAF